MIEYHVIGKVLEEKCFIKIIDYDYFGYIDYFNKFIELPCDMAKIECYAVPDNTFEFEKKSCFKEYRECFIISSEREFRENDIINYNGKDYKVEYKYNKELEQHQLYINHVIETIKLSENFIIQYQSNFNKMCEYKREKEESKKLSNRLKKMFKRQ